MVRKIMYRKIIQLKKQGKTNLQINLVTGCDLKTIRKYLKMNDNFFTEYQKKHKFRQKVFDRFKDEIISVYEANDFKKLIVSSVYDYLEEKNGYLPANEGSLRNFIHFLINTKQIVFNKTSRIYGKVDELEYGKQMQLDFGEYILPSGLKLYIFATLLSRSRYKYVAFQDRPFRTEDVILHLLDSFDYYGGVPEELVIDQDKIMVVSENHGDIIYTKNFSYFLEEVNLKMYVCRKADPESKGKVENLVKFVKQNFLNCRNFDDIHFAKESLCEWLIRRANGKISQATKKLPLLEIDKERLYLRPIINSIFRKELQIKREDSTVSDKARIGVMGSFYTLPVQYKNKTVEIYVTENDLFVYDSYSGDEIAEYKLSITPGKVLTDRAISRESKEKIETLKEAAFLLFENNDWKLFLKKTFKEKSRYVRDQCVEAKKYFSKIDQPTSLQKALAFCLDNKTFSIGQLKDTYQYFIKDECITVSPYMPYEVVTNNTNVSSISVETHSLDKYKEVIRGLAS